MKFDATTRRNWGFRDATNERKFNKFPMQLFQESLRANQKTYDVEQIAARHFDADYAKGYVAGWNA